jgi:hypothetical protein
MFVINACVFAVLSMGMSHVPIDDIAVGDRVQTPTACAPYDDEDPVRVDVDVENADGHIFALSLQKNASCAFRTTAVTNRSPRHP